MTCVCVLLGAGGVGVVGKRIVFGLYQSWRNRGKCGLCFGCDCVGGVGGGVGGRLGPGSGRVVWGGVKSVFVVSLDSLC